MRKKTDFHAFFLHGQRSVTTLEQPLGLVLWVLCFILWNLLALIRTHIREVRIKVCSGRLYVRHPGDSAPQCIFFLMFSTTKISPQIEFIFHIFIGIHKVLRTYSGKVKKSQDIWSSAWVNYGHLGKVNNIFNNKCCCCAIRAFT